MASTYEKIATTTLGSSAADITFSSISSAYTDIVLIFSGVRDSGGDLDLGFRFNSDSGSNYSDTEIRYTPTSINSYRNANQTFTRLGVLTSSQTMLRANIMNYSNTTTYKTAISRVDSRNTEYGATARTSLWRSTSAINSITIYSGAGNIASGATATIYGILKA
jgi:hypothetical protein